MLKVSNEMSMRVKVNSDCCQMYAVIGPLFEPTTLVIFLPSIANHFRLALLS